MIVITSWEWIRQESNGTLLACRLVGIASHREPDGNLLTVFFVILPFDFAA